jgi:hypothetical protein
MTKKLKFPESHAEVQALSTHASPLPAQVPHSRVSLQPSLIVPHSFPSAAHVVGVHVPAAQTLAIPPPPQVSPATVQVPHASVPPQLSSIVPQFFPAAAQVVAVQATAPQALGAPPPPHVSPDTVQVPQLSVPPQPSSMLPHAAPAALQVVGVQSVDAGWATSSLPHATARRIDVANIPRAIGPRIIFRSICGRRPALVARTTSTTCSLKLAGRNFWGISGV